jgi:GntR family transcriptional regulator
MPRAAYWDSGSQNATLCCMALDHDSPEALYMQLAAELRQQIRSGRLTGKIPTIIDLAADYDVSEATVRSAIAVLKEEGVVATSRGRGTFAISPRGT